MFKNSEKRSSSLLIDEQTVSLLNCLIVEKQSIGEKGRLCYKILPEWIHKIAQSELKRTNTEKKNILGLIRKQSESSFQHFFSTVRQHLPLHEGAWFNLIVQKNGEGYILFSETFEQTGIILPNNKN